MGGTYAPSQTYQSTDVQDDEEITYSYTERRAPAPAPASAIQDRSLRAPAGNAITAGDIPQSTRENLERLRPVIRTPTDTIMNSQQIPGEQDVTIPSNWGDVKT